MNNEKGQALLTVLLVSLIFTVLGLTIVAASINSNQRTGVRIDDIELTAEATRTLNEAIAVFSQKVSSNINLSEPNLLSGKLDNELLLEIRTDLTNKFSENLEIEDITDNGEFGAINKSKHLTRIFRFSYTNENTDGRAKIIKKVSRIVYLAPTPSFLKYAIGSGPEGKLYLNGATEIVGDLHSGFIFTDDLAWFTDTDDSLRRSNETLLPRILPNNDQTGGNIFYREEINNLTDSPSIIKNINDHFDEPKPTIIKDTADFISVNFESTLAQIFNDIIGNSKFTASDFTSTYSMTNAVNELKNDSLVQQIDYCEETSPQGAQRAQAYIYNSNIIQGNSCNHFLENSWFIIDGDLQIPRDTEIPGNIIVTGNLIIQGNEFDNSQPDKLEVEEDDNIYFNSTIYVMGKTSITNTNIKRLNNAQSSKLLLLTKGNLSIYRINEFNTNNKDIEPLDAFFYTDSEADLYGVASLFKINGGLFANKKLTVNAIRQNSFSKTTNDLKSVIDPVILQRNSESRFFVEHDRSVLLDPDRLNSLPRVDKYQLLYDQVIVENGEVSSSP
ncbi:MULTISPECIES: hypothetical protein [Bacillaceae]|uniref:hypothetical protein n=1 Tax=Bacillaceae TaxID=186817 RepID=UPI000BFB67D6|nr:MULTISPECIES: hypothetical protein [Bacillaceae]PGT88156.1 hypothetical protein COD11_06350 [Bacillus sp. AFS040349]UGB29694.1 hypothetical protein LPC09_18380 [Metabacillus sp. B2-18]